jgi:hypothetical protein
MSSLDVGGGPLEYPYRPKVWIMLLGILFFGACAAGLVNEAQGNDRGLILNGILELSPGGATIFYWCVAGASVALGVLAVLGCIAGLRTPRVVRLTATDISAPKFLFSRTETVVPIAEFLDVHVQRVARERFLKIKHRKGKLTISQGHLPDRQAFDDLCAALADRLTRSSAP